MYLKLMVQQDDNAPVNNTPHCPTPVPYRGIDRELTGVPPRVGEIDMDY